MPLTHFQFLADLQAFRVSTALPFAGLSFDRLALGISLGVFQWVPTVVLQGTSVGVAGAGQIFPLASKVVVPPNPALAVSAIQSGGLLGPLGLSLGTVLGQAIPNTINVSGTYYGTSAGVGTGVDTSKVVVASPTALALILSQTLRGTVGSGVSIDLMSTSISLAVSALVLQGTGTAVVSGSVSSAPSVGITSSILI